MEGVEGEDGVDGVVYKAFSTQLVGKGKAHQDASPNLRNTLAKPTS